MDNSWLFKIVTKKIYSLFNFSLTLYFVYFALKINNCVWESDGKLKNWILIKFELIWFEFSWLETCIQTEIYTDLIIWSFDQSEHLVWVSQAMSQGRESQTSEIEMLERLKRDWRSRLAKEQKQILTTFFF